MSDFLEQVIAERRADVAQAKAEVPEMELNFRMRERLTELQQRMDLPFLGVSSRGDRFTLALRDRARRGHLAVIAEIKRRSPAMGRTLHRIEIGPEGQELSRAASVAIVAMRYEQGGATAISVLTEPRHWAGSFDDLAAVRDAVRLPLLCKDVIVDEYQIVQARTAGADAVLLIAEALTDNELRRLGERAMRLGMGVLVEAHEPVAFGRAVKCGFPMVGVNARDLRHPSEIDTGRVRLLHSFARADQVLIAESGITSVDDARLLPGRVDAILVGSALMGDAERMPLLEALVGIRRRVGV
jgi:indole-3-glycerol phosphate synthase